MLNYGLAKEGKSMVKEYLGDGAYVEFDGFGIVLTTEDGISTTNRVVLEPSVLKAFESYVTRLRAELIGRSAGDEDGMSVLS